MLGIAAAATVAGGTAFLDSALAVGFAGAVLASIASTGARNPLNAALRRGPLAFYGRISYGLYMIHIMVFIYFGWFDLRMDPYGMAGNLAVVAFRLVATTLVATRSGTDLNRRSEAEAIFLELFARFAGRVSEMAARTGKAIPLRLLIPAQEMYLRRPYGTGARL